MLRMILPVTLPLCLHAAAMAAEGTGGTWKVHPTVDRGQVKEYTPTFEKHFKVEGGILRGTCGLGPEIYAKHRCTSFKGVGNIWATNAAWPADLADFELTFDYKWFQEEPMKKFGDFPDMNVGLRLNAAGRGYLIQWGFLGQIRPYRTGKGGGVIGLGSHRGLKGRWAKVRILAAGAILKVKVWPEEFRGKRVEEPARWNVECYDNWEATGEKDFRRGAIALGFHGRRLFDTCVYEYRNVKLRVLTAEEAGKVTLFDPKTAPAGYVKGASTSNVKTAKPYQPATTAAVADAANDANAKVQGSETHITIQSTDGQPAFAWKKHKLRKFIFRAKSSKGARPLLGVKVTDPDSPTRMSYMDPLWRPGVAAVLYENANHTANCARFEWKDDTEYDFIVHASHWTKWQILEVGNPTNRVNFSARTYQFNRRTSTMFLGIGAAGKAGTVTVTKLLIE